jgi:hypothetical protein
MANKTLTTPETENDTPKAPRRNSPLGRTLVLGGAFWVGMTVVEGGISLANDYLREAQTEMRADNSRDAVIRVLADINEKKREPLKDLMRGAISVSTNLRTETVGGHILKINRNSLGYVIGIGTRAFFVGQTEPELELALEQARHAIMTISEARTGFESALAYGEPKR